MKDHNMYFDLSIHDLIKLQNFTCVATYFICVASVSRRIYQIACGIWQIFKQKTVGPTYH